MTRPAPARATPPLLPYVNIVTYEPSTNNQHARGYPATHAMIDGGRGALCGIHLRHFWINDYSGQSTNCKRCLKKLGQA